VWLTAGALTLLAAACGDQGDTVFVPDQVDDPAPDPEQQTEEGDPVCPYVGDPQVDVSAFPECPMCATGGARCVPKLLLPADKLDSFGDCDADNACVPELIMVTGGQFIPDTCESVFGAEGRCLSRCLPSVAAKADSLPQSSCGASDACVPCFDPFTQESTGACEQSCDPGPRDEPIALPGCCSGDGVCLPTEEVGDKADDLGQDVCAQNEGDRVCVPTAFLDEGFKPMTCVDEFIFGDEPGVCLPACLPAVQGLIADFTLDQQGCPANNLCAPCNNPLTGDPTGACDL
jgi:hypothetical protein